MGAVSRFTTFHHFCLREAKAGGFASHLSGSERTVSGRFVSLAAVQFLLFHRFVSKRHSPFAITFACSFQGVVLPVVDRLCSVLARQCRKKRGFASHLTYPTVFRTKYSIKGQHDKPTFILHLPATCTLAPA